MIPSCQLSNFMSIPEFPVSFIIVIFISIEIFIERMSFMYIGDVEQYIVRERSFVALLIVLHHHNDQHCDDDHAIWTKMAIKSFFLGLEVFSMLFLF